MYNQIGDTILDSVVETDNHLQKRHQGINHLIDDFKNIHTKMPHNLKFNYLDKIILCYLYPELPRV